MQIWSVLLLFSTHRCPAHDCVEKENYIFLDFILNFKFCTLIFYVFWDWHDWHPLFCPKFIKILSLAKCYLNAQDVNKPKCMEKRLDNVVPENIHTSPTEWIFSYTFPFLCKFQLSFIHFFTFFGLRDPPPPRKFQSPLWGQGYFLELENENKSRGSLNFFWKPEFSISLQNNILND